MKMRTPLFCLLLFAPVFQAAPVRGDVVLNEILADPARDWNGDAETHFRDDEWVEIANTGPGSVSLEGYRLAGADTTWRYEFSGTLEVGEVRVVFGSESYEWEQNNGHPQYGLRMANGGGTLGLWRLTSQDTVLVDEYTYQDHEAEDDRSSGRFPDGSGDWTLFDSLNPYTGSTPPMGTGCAPSPGVTASCPTPSAPETWGGVKTRYQ
jgi:hypothetical protein